MLDYSKRPRVPAIAIFARAPTPGKVKTRLIPLLGSKGAARLQAALISDVIHKVNALAGVSAYFFLSGRSSAVRARRRGPRQAGAGRRPYLSRYIVARQRGADLGERLEGAFRRLLHRHPAALVIGTDSPMLPPRIVRQALRELRLCEAVLGPSPDGGYYLIGLRRQCARISHGIFRGIRWGSASAFRDTLRNLLDRGFGCSILEPFEDIDRPEDFLRLKEELSGSVAARRLAPAVWQFVKEYRGKYKA